VLFAVGGEAFALPAPAVAEVLPTAELACPPGMPPALAGFLDLGGTAVAVLRTGRLLGLDDEADPELYGHMLLLGEPCVGLALMVDRVVAVRRVPAGDRRQIGPDETFRGCVVGEIADPQGAAHLLSVDRLLSEAERQKLQAFRQAEAGRRALLEDPP